jgi:uncharacterized membrane protein YfhO
MVIALSGMNSLTLVRPWRFVKKPIVTQIEFLYLAFRESYNLIPHSKVLLEILLDYIYMAISVSVNKNLEESLSKNRI